MFFNPFTFNFFNPVLDYFICKDDHRGHALQWAISLALIFIGISILALLIFLDNKEFKKKLIPSDKTEGVITDGE